MLSGSRSVTIAGIYDGPGLPLSPLPFSECKWIKVSGRGTVYSYIVYHVAYDAAFQGDLPYVVALVELEEGPHLLTNIVGCDPREVTCDMAVEVVWDDVTETVSLPKFMPAKG